MNFIRSHMRPLLLALLCAVLGTGTLVLSSCHRTPPPDDVPPAPSSGEVSVIENNVTDFVLVYGAADADGRAESIAFFNMLRSVFSGVRLAPQKDSDTPTGGHEILVGNTDRALSAELIAAVNARDGGNDLVWGFAYRDGQFAFYTTNTEAREKAFADMKTRFFREGGNFIVTDDLLFVGIVTREAYNRELEEKAAEEEERRLEEIRQKTEALKAENAAFTAFDKLPSPTVTRDLLAAANKTYPAPRRMPTAGQHPRVLFTSSDIPGIRQAMDRAENAEAREIFLSLVHRETDGKLPEAYKHGGGIHNYDGTVLAAIQAKAFYYQVYGDAFAGYSAVLAMKNFLNTLDIKYIFSDQTRQFGHVMYVTACVYDWCYDLMSDTDRTLFAAGVEHFLLTGTTEITDDRVTYGGIKMEIGFPPTQQGSVTGHGSEMALLRDYLSFAIAVYDEMPSWYTLIAGRFYEDFVPVRNVYYQAGVYPQGVSCYAPWRHMADLYSAWLIEAACGENPYIPEMCRVVPSLYAMEIFEKSTLPSGDGASGLTATFVNCLSGSAMIASYLFDSGALRAQAKYYTNDFTTYGYGVADLTPTEFFICSSSGVETAADRHEGMDMLLYNGGYFGQLIARNSWSEDVALCLMKGAGRTTANHDHGDAGTFQIYYKGVFSGSAGVYDGYATPHHWYYHQATLSKNGLLVYNPNLADTNGGYYSGSQRKPGEAANLPSWQNNSAYDTGTVTSVSRGYAADGSPLWGCITADLTPAYDAATVAYAGRSMMTVYTGDASMPMILFVFDRVTGKSADYRKTFLLQAISEPVIDGKTVIIEKAGGRLVLQSLLGGDDIRAYGGEDKHYWIGAQNKGNPAKYGDDGMWGHIEISPATGNLTDDMMHVLYVTDAGETVVRRAELLRGDGYTGARVAGTVSLFATGNPIARALAFAGDADGAVQSYYLSGLAAGTWNITYADGRSESMSVKEGENFLHFRAQGTVTITPGDDIEIEDPDHRTVLRETYDGVTIDTEKKNLLVNGIQYACAGKTGISMRTIGTGKDAALRIGQKGADGNRDPAINITPAGGLAGAVGDLRKVSFSFRLAKDGTLPVPTSAVRMRIDTSSSVCSLLNTAADGAVYFKDATGKAYAITVLTETYQDITVTVDFEAGTMTACVNGEAVTDAVSLPLPAAWRDRGAAAYLDAMTGWIYNWYFSPNSTAECALLIGGLSVTAHR